MAVANKKAVPPPSGTVGRPELLYVNVPKKPGVKGLVCSCKVAANLLIMSSLVLGSLMNSKSLIVKLPTESWPAARF